MVDAPCSRVGHVYRRWNPNGAAGTGVKGNYIGRVSLDRAGRTFRKPCFVNIFLHVLLAVAMRGSDGGRPVLASRSRL